jgi:hypothetical protein
MKAFRTVVVGVILSAMFSPAISLAKTDPATAPVPARQIVQTGVTLAGAVASTANPVNTQNTQSSESSQYAQREQQSKDVQDFKGGAVYIYGGATLVLLIILLIILI